MIDIYFLKVSATGLGILIQLNGVPVVVEPEGFGFEETMPVNQWLKSDNNTLQVSLIRPEPDAEDEADSGGTGEPEEAQVSLFLHQQGADAPTPALVLAELNWPSAGVTPTYPHDWSQPLTGPLNVPPGMSLWNRTVPIGGIDTHAQQSMHQIAVNVAKLLSQKNLEEAFRFMGIKYQDEAIAEGKPPERIKAAVIELWEYMVSIPDIRLEEMAIDMFDFDLVGEQHLVKMARKDGMPAILFEDAEDETVFGIPLYFSKIGDQWVIIR